MLSNKVNVNESKKKGKNTYIYGSRHVSEPIPKFGIPEEEMPSKDDYQLINDELNLDGNPNLNLQAL